MVSNSDTEATSNGVLFINKNEYFGIHNIIIRNNFNCSAILAVTSNLVFEGATLLSNNTAASGGGLLLCKNGIMYLRPHTNLTIVDNRVKHTGGGICVESQCIQTAPRCFFQLDSVSNTTMLQTINITIDNNIAFHAGKNLYGGEVDYCYMLDDPLYGNDGNNSLKIFHKIFTIPDKSSSSITSIPHRVCLCNATTQRPECNQPDMTKRLYPGENFNITVVTVGQLTGNVPGTVVAKWLNKNVTLQKLEYYQRIENISCKSISYTALTNKTELINSTLQLTAAQTGDISGHLKLDWFIPLNIKVEILPCPVGFKLQQSKCNCNTLINKQDVKCTLSNHTPTIHKQHSRSWIGTHEKTKQVMTFENCPYDYCIRGANISTGENYLDQDAQCNFNRTGILCGMCNESLSMVLGSHECKLCSNNYLSLLLLFALGGLILVFIITVLNFTITEGTLSGLIFYANIVRQNRDIFDPQGNDEPFAKLLHVFIAWLNLDIGIPICFYNGMDTYQKAWLHFIFPVYIWLITIAIIYLCKKSQIMAKLASKNAVKVLATLILLSFTRFTQAAVKVFSYASLTIDATSNATQTSLWLEDANIPYLQGKHLILFIFGILCVVVSFPFALIWFFVKQLHYVSHLRLFRWVQTLKPFLDAYTGPHTDNGRFWSGLLLLVRIALSTVGGISSLESVEMKSKIGLFVIILLLSISKAVRPGIYSKFYLDYLETFFLLNLGTLYLTTLYFLKDKTGDNINIAYQVLVGSAFFVFIGIVIYHIYLKARRFRCTAVMIKRIRTLVGRVRVIERKKDRLQEFPPFVQFNEDREPLLADHED